MLGFCRFARRRLSKSSPRPDAAPARFPGRGNCPLPPVRRGGQSGVGAL